MKNQLKATVLDVGGRGIAVKAFAETLAHNMSIQMVCPVKSALCAAMGLVELPFEDWVRVVQVMLPELSDMEQLRKYIHEEDYTYANIREGEKQLLSFEMELDRRTTPKPSFQQH